MSKHFDIREFVPKLIWDTYGERSAWFVDPRLIDSMDHLRSFFGAPITVNNWHTGGSFQNRGFRHPNSTQGGRLSQHRFGRACDFNVAGLKANDVYYAILNSWPEMVMSTAFTTLEDVADTPTWTHIDIRAVDDRSKPLIVKP